MFFGLCNSPVTFQMMMNDILQDFIHNGEAICYMDDILIYSHTLSDHWRIVCQVLTALQKQRLFLKPEKCKFEQKEVKYLRLVISKDHVAMDPMKVHRVVERPTPTKVKEVQSFLGFVNFYQKFICDFSNIAHCHARHQRGSRCGKVWSDTWAELAYDGVEGSTYVIGAWTATVSRMLAWT